MRTFCFNMPLFLLTFNLYTKVYIFGALPIISRLPFFVEWNLMIYIWNLDAKIKMKMDKKITTNFARPNKRFVANAKLQCGVCLMSYQVPMDGALCRKMCVRERESHYYAVAVAMRVLRSEKFHTMLPIRSVGVETVVFGATSRHFTRAHITEDRTEKEAVRTL